MNDCKCPLCGAPATKTEVSPNVSVIACPCVPQDVPGVGMCVCALMGTRKGERCASCPELRPQSIDLTSLL